MIYDTFMILNNLSNVCFLNISEQWTEFIRPIYLNSYDSMWDQSLWGLHNINVDRMVPAIWCHNKLDMF